MGKFVVSDHPLVRHKMSRLRNKNTSFKEFREIIGEIAMLLAYEATREIPLVDIDVETPIAIAKCKTIEKKIAIIPILRAGTGMSDGIQNLIPTARIGHIGIYRDPETLTPVEYFCKLPTDVSESEVLLVDPMLATGVSAEAAIGFLKERGVENVTLLCTLAAPEGVKRVQASYPDVDIYAADYDQILNEHGYIVPGLGDAGDRIFGTK